VVKTEADSEDEEESNVEISSNHKIYFTEGGKTIKVISY
jgi:hypothetical protein